MFLCVLMICHFLADFTFQTNKMAEKKAKKFRYVALHSGIYTVLFLVVIFTFIGLRNGIIPLLIISATHLIIDWLRQYVEKRISKNKLFYAFVIDQFMHILIIVVVFLGFDINDFTNAVYNQLQAFEWFNPVLTYLLIFVIVWDTTAVFVKELFKYILNKETPSEDTNEAKEEKEDPKIGSIIGKLERIIISILVLCGQIGAIGFVLTAKSIARFPQFSEPKFAEKYLVGTLTSTAIALITTFALKYIFLS